jgi:hypothetical protein
MLNEVREGEEEITELLEPMTELPDDPVFIHLSSEFYFKFKHY